jgi:alkanesulfonate monooxygenase SsuD/methylene tetrahydromethanopterin reductase-like flavin-dependent oxidoreductase (luciferase family)
MTSPFLRSPELRAANPILNDHPLKLGVFGSNWSGMTMTTLPETYVPTWEASMEVGRLADEIGFDAIVPVSRWKSVVPGNPQHQSGQCLENFTWATATAVSTRRAAVFVTCHVATYPPVLAAKQAATIDQICGGRLGLNLVAGWNSREALMFGNKLLLDHDERYRLASEWIDIVQRVWESDEEFDFHGEFFDLEGAFTEPKPAQAPGPVIMNAGSSGQGRAFSAKYSDMAFVSIKSLDEEAAAATVESYRQFARAEYGREVGVWAPAAIVYGDTDEEAQAKADWMVEHGDFAAIETNLAEHDRTGSTHGRPDDLYRRLILGSGSYPLIGSAETIAARLQMLSDAGLDGLLISWFDYAGGLRHFAAEVMPLLEERGLRRPARAAAEVGSAAN